MEKRPDKKIMPDIQDRLIPGKAADGAPPLDGQATRAAPARSNRGLFSDRDWLH